MKATNLERRGVPYPNQCPEVQQRRKATSLANWGVPYPMQHPDVARKQQASRYKRKRYVFQDGRERWVQGYEPYPPNQIHCGKDIQFTVPYFFEGKHRVYHPDIYLLLEHKIIEVKSTWTYAVDKEKNLAKEAACLSQGYQFEFWVLNGKEELLEPSAFSGVSADKNWV